MKRNGDIIVIENDPDDWELLLDVFGEVMDEQKYDNRVIIFEDSTMVIEYLKESPSEFFMILSDINMPYLDGFQLREQIVSDPALSKRCLPYIFLTTAGTNKSHLEKASGMGVQCYFEKPSSFTGYKKLIAEIMGYWQHSMLPQ